MGYCIKTVTPKPTGEKGKKMKITTLLIGYTRNVGQFPSKDTGELVDYSHRIVRFITNSGATTATPGKENIGYSQFSEKIKRSELAGILGVPDDDKAVDAALDNLLQKEVITSFAPVGEKMTLVYFAPVPKS